MVNLSLIHSNKYIRGVIDCNEWKTETPRMRQYGESKTTRIMMTTVPHVTSGSELRKFQADGILLDRVYTSRKIKPYLYGSRLLPDSLWLQ